VNNKKAMILSYFYSGMNTNFPMQNKAILINIEKFWFCSIGLIIARMKLKSEF